MATLNQAERLDLATEEDLQNGAKKTINTTKKTSFWLSEWKTCANERP